MNKELPVAKESPDVLRKLVKVAVQQLGDAIRLQVGEELYAVIEGMRKNMIQLRSASDLKSYLSLKETLLVLEKKTPSDRKKIAKAFTLMLQLTNACENAYRSHRLLAKESHSLTKNKGATEAIIYVLTAHPTEARSPENVTLFHLIQDQLQALLNDKNNPSEILSKLLYLLNLAWNAPLVRKAAPEVIDEAEYIYSKLFNKEILNSLLEASYEITPVYIRTWVGGDKDGHPGVDEKIMFCSLNLSRKYIVNYMYNNLNELKELHRHIGLAEIVQSFDDIVPKVTALKNITNGEESKIKSLRLSLLDLLKKYKNIYKTVPAQLTQLNRLFHVFPGLVVPLELRESSDVLLSDKANTKNLAIDKMLEKIAQISQNGNPLWYVRGFVVSMASAVEHLQLAEERVKRAFGGIKIPIIPLFENAKALQLAPEIIEDWLSLSKTHSPSVCEVMLGYSDSAKESGVLYSRTEIAKAMFSIEKVCRKQRVKLILFQGSGGSVDRGGGNIEDQISWWSESALKNYKVTVQGEMVDRFLASKEITKGRIAKISRSTSELMSHSLHKPNLAPIGAFIDQVSGQYKAKINDAEFLNVIQKATPYSVLGELRIGSRPSRRTTEFTVNSLRAIPWVLCWTQTRVLFPTWWGVGRAWKLSDDKSRKLLRKAFKNEPVFASYIRALGFTLAKVELSVWRMYLDRADITPEMRNSLIQDFAEEYQGALSMLRSITKERDPVWFQPWLGASIHLRSSMIHPLNLLQIIALKEKDFELFRMTVTGISSGMMTTG
jgi:phosphoenolpyruvate carboxylase